MAHAERMSPVPEDHPVDYLRCQLWHCGHQCARLPDHLGHCAIITDHGEIEHYGEVNDAQVATSTVPRRTVRRLRAALRPNLPVESENSAA